MPGKATTGSGTNSGGSSYTSYNGGSSYSYSNPATSSSNATSYYNSGSGAFLNVSGGKSGGGGSFYQSASTGSWSKTKWLFDESENDWRHNVVLWLRWASRRLWDATLCRLLNHLWCMICSLHEATVAEAESEMWEPQSRSRYEKWFGKRSHKQNLSTSLFDYSIYSRSFIVYDMALLRVRRALEVVHFMAHDLHLYKNKKDDLFISICTYVCTYIVVVYVVHDYNIVNYILRL